MKLRDRILQKLQAFLSWMFPYGGQPWKHISEEDMSYVRFKRTLNNVVTGYATRPAHELDRGVKI